uniref:Scm polycomb group protein like 4 n=1 Tax=Canis lupus dingo TaxID=286419 RepID=A0A8C0KZG5_CANLU
MNRYSVDPSASAFSHRGSLPTSSSLYCKRQNSGDGHLGGGLVTTAGGPRSSPMSSGGLLAPGLRPPGSSPKRNGTSLEGNRCASNPSPAGQDARRPRSRNPSTWTVEDVVRFVKDADPQALGPHVELFRKHVGAGWGPGLGGGRAGAAGGGWEQGPGGAPRQASHLVWLLGRELCPIYSSVLAFTSSACRHVVLKLFRRF